MFQVLGHPVQRPRASSILSSVSGHLQGLISRLCMHRLLRRQRRYGAATIRCEAAVAAPTVLAAAARYGAGSPYGQARAARCGPCRDATRRKSAASAAMCWRAEMVRYGTNTSYGPAVAAARNGPGTFPGAARAAHCRRVTSFVRLFPHVCSFHY